MGLGLFDKNMDFGEVMRKECQNGNRDFPQREKGTCASFLKSNCIGNHTYFLMNLKLFMLTSQF